MDDHRVLGIGEKVAGSAKEATGMVTSDEELQAEGELRDTVRYAADK